MTRPDYQAELDAELIRHGSELKRILKGREGQVWDDCCYKYKVGKFAPPEAPETPDIEQPAEPTVPAEPKPDAYDIDSAAELRDAMKRLDGKGGTLRLTRDLTVVYAVELASGSEGSPLVFDGDGHTIRHATSGTIFRAARDLGHFYARNLKFRVLDRDVSDGATGFAIFGGGEDLVFDKIDIEGLAGGIVIQGAGAERFNDVWINDCRFSRNHRDRDNGHASDIYLDAVDDWDVTGSRFLYSGWLPGGHRDLGRTMFNHGLYAQKNCGRGYIVGNVFAFPSSHAAQLRGGGAFNDNFVYGSAIGPMVQQAASIVERNVILGGSDISPTQGRGTGVQVYPCVHAIVRDNIIADQVSGRDWAHAISASYRDGDTIDVPVTLGAQS
jgi:hypothetical protein